MTTETETSIGGYAKVGELTLAHSIKTELIDVGPTQTLTLDTIELDVPIPDERFRME